jgi:hypothetical protein
MGGGAEVNGPILNAAKAAKAQIPTVNLLKVLAVREINGGLELGLARLGDADKEVAKAAWGVVAVMGKPDLLPELLERCETLPQELEPFAEAALVGIIQRAENPEVAAGPVVNAYQGALGTGRYRAILVRVLGQSGAKGAFAQLTRAIQSGTVEVRRAAVSALALWPTNEPIELLAGRFEVEEDAAARLMILRAAVPLVMQPGVMSEEALLTQVRRMTAAAKDRREKDQAAAVAARVEAPATLELLAEMASKEPERAASLESMMKRLSATLEKVCLPEAGSISLPVEKAVLAPAPGNIEVKKGVLSGWSGAGDAVGWLVEVKEPGRYRVQVSQAQQEGAAVVYDVLFAGERLATKSVLTGGNEAAFKDFEIGFVEVPQPGHHRLILKVRQMPPGAGDFQLKALLLKRE